LLENSAGGKRRRSKALFAQYIILRSMQKTRSGAFSAIYFFGTKKSQAEKHREAYLKVLTLTTPPIA
jgi:hypothetical protein